MPQPRLPLRLIFLAALALGAALLVGLLVATLNSLLDFYQHVAAMPLWLRLPLIVALALAVAVTGWLLWRLARPTRTTSPATTPPV